MQKRLLLLTLTAVVLLTACGQKADVIKTDNKQETAEGAEQEKQDKETDRPSEEEALEPSEASQAEMPEQEENSEFSKGTVSESGWERGRTGRTDGNQ